MPQEPRRPRPVRALFETRSQSWRDVGLARAISKRAVRRARVEAFILLPAFGAIVFLFSDREDLLGKTTASNWDAPLRIITVLALLILGWAIARDIGRALGPALFRRLDPATAGTVGFLIRLVTVAIVLIVALSIGGIDSRTIAVGGGFTAVIFGLAAQQTLGNLIAGTVLLSARPFRVGERVRLQGGALAGQVEGIVSSLGLLYTTFAAGDDQVLVPNSVVLNIAVTPLREPESVNLRARLRPGVTPADLQHVLAEELQTSLRSEPRITLEEIDGEEVVVLIAATPEHASDGPQLASELLAAVTPHTRSDRDRREGSGNGPVARRDEQLEAESSQTVER
jgi:small-conductance mechanosensitive channel